MTKSPNWSDLNDLNNLNDRKLSSQYVGGTKTIHLYPLILRSALVGYYLFKY